MGGVYKGYWLDKGVVEQMRGRLCGGGEGSLDEGGGVRQRLHLVKLAFVDGEEGEEISIEADADTEVGPATRATDLGKLADK